MSVRTAGPRAADAPSTVVTHVVTKMEFGGAQQTVLSLAAHQAERGWDVSVVSGVEGRLVPELRRLRGVAAELWPEMVHPIAPGPDWACHRRLTAYFRARRPGIVHTHSSKAGVLGRAAARSAGVGRIFHTAYGWSFHGGQGRTANALYRLLERRAGRVCERLVAVSDAVRAQGIAARIAPAERIVTIVNAVDVRRFLRARHSPARAAAKRASLGLPPAGPVVGMVANFKPQKAPGDFVATAARIAAARADASFLFVGGGEKGAEIEDAASSAGLGGRFVLAGWRDDVSEILPLFSVLLHTSLWEGLPMAVLQAMACGVPVVATAVDGTEEALVDGESGYLVRARDVPALAERALALLADAARAKQVGEAGRRRVRALPGADLPAMLAAYDALMEPGAV